MLDSNASITQSLSPMATLKLLLQRKSSAKKSPLVLEQSMTLLKPQETTPTLMKLLNSERETLRRRLESQLSMMRNGTQILSSLLSFMTQISLRVRTDSQEMIPSAELLFWMKISQEPLDSNPLRLMFPRMPRKLRLKLREMTVVMELSAACYQLSHSPRNHHHIQLKNSKTIFQKKRKLHSDITKPAPRLSSSLSARR